MTLPQIPRVAEIIGPGIDATVAARPSTLKFINLGAGRYADVFEGWGAQAALAIRRLADECASARLRLAKGQSLTELARSEFSTYRQLGKLAAIGYATLGRAPGVTPGGAIPKGFRFRRDALTSTTPRVPGMTYEVTQDVPVTSASLAVTLPIAATREGSDGNAPKNDGAIVGTLVMADTPFDPNFGVRAYECAGGSDGENDDDLERQAFAYGSGQYAPTLGAIVAGALRGTGVHRAAVLDVAALSDGTPAAFTGVCIADASWGASGLWQALIAQIIASGTGNDDEFLGFGCKAIVSGVSNVLVRVECTVLLRDANALNYTSDITAAIQKVCLAYFDDRPDWYTFRLAGLRAVISRADPRILACSIAAVKAVADSSTVPEPPAIPVATSSGLRCSHWLLVSNGVLPTFIAPT